MDDRDYVTVARADEVVEGKAKVVSIAGRSILLCRSGGQVFAVENRCSHAEEPLACGRIRAGWISCPVHGARFDLETGEAINPPAQSPIATFPVRIAGDAVAIAL